PCTPRMISKESERCVLGGARHGGFYARQEATKRLRWRRTSLPGKHLTLLCRQTKFFPAAIQPIGAYRGLLSGGQSARGDAYLRWGHRSRCTMRIKALGLCPCDRFSAAGFGPHVRRIMFTTHHDHGKRDDTQCAPSALYLTHPRGHDVCSVVS